MSRTDKTDPWWVRVPYEPEKFETWHHHERGYCDIENFAQSQRTRVRTLASNCSYWPTWRRNDSQSFFNPPSKARSIARRIWWHRERQRTRLALLAGRYEDLDGRTRHGVLWDLS